MVLHARTDITLSQPRECARFAMELAQNAMEVLLKTVRVVSISS